MKANDRGMTEDAGGKAGSTLDDFLAEEGLLEEATEHAVRSVLAWQIDEAMRDRNLSKAAGDGDLPSR